MRIAAAVLCGFFMDLCLGDPDWMPHPVIYMGKAISALEKFLRRKFPDTQKGLLMAGAALAAILPLGSFLMAAAVIYLAGLVHPVLAFFAGNAVVLAGACGEGTVYREHAGEKKSWKNRICPAPGARWQELSEGIRRIWTQRELQRLRLRRWRKIFSDGVAAPLFYLVIGGAPLGLCYKAINTMDSMVGYKNDRYLYFGRAAAKLDDVANYIPARISAFLMMFAALLTGTGCKTGVSNLEARPLQSRKPEFRPDRKCGGRSTGHPACRGCMVFWKAGKKADDWRKSADGGSSRYYAD